MAQTTNLELRGKIWWAYRTVPPKLRAIVGKRTLRRSLATSDLAEAQQLKLQALADFAAELDHARRTGTCKTDPVAHHAREMQGFLTDVVGADGRPASSSMRAALITLEAHKVELQFGKPAAKRFATLIADPKESQLDVHLAEFQAQSRATPKTQAEQRTALRRLLAWKPSLTLTNLDRRTASQYVAQALTFTDSPVTKNKQITCLSSYWRWLQRKGYVDDNPWRGQFLPKGRPGERLQERPFSDVEVETLLAGPAEPRLADTMRIAALSGMRIDEICMLRVRDCVHGLFTIRKAKTAAGIRQVPIHPALNDIVAVRTSGKAADEFLIHELGPAPKADAVRARSDPLGKQFVRHRRDLKVDDVLEGRRRSLVNFHSFRRWFVTKAEHAGQPPWVIESVVGHKRTGMTLGVYSAGSSLAQLRACVEAVQLPE